MTIERAAEIMDPESKEKFYGKSGKQEVFEAMRLAKLALEKRIKTTPICEKVFNTQSSTGSGLMRNLKMPPSL